VGSEEDAPVPSEEEKNMALVRRFWEAVANAELDTLDELLAPAFVDHSSLPAKSLAARATSSRWPTNTLPSLMFGVSSRIS
jgi:hypothetical protein